MDEDTAYLVSRLRRVVELLNAGEVHMAITKLNADISALSGCERMETSRNEALEGALVRLIAASDPCVAGGEIENARQHAREIVQRNA